MKRAAIFWLITFLALFVGASSFADSVSGGASSPVQRRQESARGDSGVLAQQWQPGRIYATKFESQAVDALSFDVANLTYTTDGGAAAVVMTDPDAVASFLTKEKDIRNANVRIRFRPAAADGKVIGDSWHGLGVRYSEVNSFGMIALDVWSTASVYLRGLNNAVSGTASSDSVLKATLGLDNANATTRYLELEVTEDLLKLRSWPDGGPIPDWQFSRRSRPAQGGVGIVDWSITTDDVFFGGSGFILIFAGAYVKELVVTELVRADANIFRNPSFTVVESAGGQRPVYWSPNRALEGDETLDVETVADWYGRERPALHFESEGNGAPGLCIDQTVFARHGRNPIIARSMPYPFSPLGPELEISVWSKGSNIQNGNPSVLLDGAGMAASVVIKYYAEDGTELGASEDPGANVHYATLGPNVGGRGTWNWHRTRVRMQLHQWWRVSYVTFTIGLHDSESSGELWIMDPEAIVVG